MNMKKRHDTIHQAAQQSVIRDEQNRRVQYVSTNPAEAVLKSLHATEQGLDAEAVNANRARYGSNMVTRQKQKSLAKRLLEAFVNPFTAILFFLAAVSTMTDMVFPFFFAVRKRSG